MKLCLLVLQLGILASAQDFDLLIRGGRIVDGTGNPSYDGDIGIRQGRIAAMGRPGRKTAARTIDASGLTVAPGFIDIHNHSDYTIVAGRQRAEHDPPGRHLHDLRRRRIGRAQQALEGFQRLLRAAPEAGDFDQHRHPTWDRARSGPWCTANAPVRLRRRNWSRCAALVKEAMEQGALGVASSLSGPPGSWIDTDTLVAMCEVASRYGGIYSTHMRTEGQGVFESVAEAIEIGRRAHVPVDIIHLKIAEHKMWGQMPELTASIAQARAQGQDVQANVYPYRAGQNNLSSIIPPWAHEGGAQAMIGRLKDPALRKRLEDEINHGIPGTNWYNHYTATGGWDGMLLVSFSNPKYKRFEGKRMSDVIQALGKPGIDVLFELLENNNGSVPTVYFHHSEDDMRYALKQPWVSIGSDGTAVTTEGPLAAGNPHPRYFGTFPRVLGRYVREEKVITMEEAIRKMTSANAAKVHQYDRGLLRPGMAADVTVFNAATIIDNATYEKPHAYATGVEYVIVNGKVVLDKGQHTGARPGTILLGPGKKL